jgi:hypothetical protein
MSDEALHPPQEELWQEILNQFLSRNAGLLKLINRSIVTINVRDSKT